MSVVELYSFLRKSMGIIQKRLEEKGVLTIPSDHTFVPEFDLGDSEISLTIPNGLLWKIKNIGNHPLLYNIDRPISEREHAILPPGSHVVIGRLGSIIYIKAPAGQTTRVKVDVLRWS